MKRIHSALAVLQAGQIPVATRCRAHLTTASLFLDLTEDVDQAVQHLRTALSLCTGSAQPIPAQLRLEVLVAATRVSQEFLQLGVLKAARPLLETLQGVLQQLPAELDDEVDSTAVQRLAAHAGILHVSLLQREGQLVAADRMVNSVAEMISELPDVPAGVAAAAVRTPQRTAGPDLVAWPSRETLQRTLSFLRTLVLAQQGEGKTAKRSLDELLQELDSAATAGKRGSVHARADAAASEVLATEARLLSASLLLARHEFSEALELAAQLYKPLCSTDKDDDERAESRGGAEAAWPTARRHGAASWLLLISHASFALGLRDEACALVRRAAASPGAASSVAVEHWCSLLRLVLDVAPGAAARHEALRQMPLSEDAKAHRTLRGAALLFLGEASLSVGNAAEAEKRLARCVKMSLGEGRCDGLTAPALTSLADAIGKDGEDYDHEGGAKRRRIEDSLSSALMIAARMEDLDAQRKALLGWSRHYAAVHDEAQAAEFGDLHAEFEGKHAAKLQKASKDGGVAALRSLAELPA
jgi:hypothetical protein